MLLPFLHNGLKKILYSALIGLALLAGITLAGCGVPAAATDLDSSSNAVPVPSQKATVTPMLSGASLPPSPAQRPTQSPAAPTAESPPTRTATVAPTARPVPTQTGVAASPGEARCRCQTACPCAIEHVVIISIDGLRPDALEQAETPALDALRAAGAYSAAAQAVLPSVTLVNHASMLGGMSPEKHGIYWNVNDPDLGKVKGPTLFSLAHKAGLSTAMVVGKPKLEHLVLPNSVDNYDYAGFTDGQVVGDALEVIRTGLPNILFIHLPDVDSAGHAMGWMSPLQLTAVSRTDGLIGKLVAALEAGHYLENTLLIITSDHGGSGRKHGSDSPEDTTVPWLAVGPGVPAGIKLRQAIVMYDTAATALFAFQLPIPPTWDGQPVLEIFTAPETVDAQRTRGQE